MDDTTRSDGVLDRVEKAPDMDQVFDLERVPVFGAGVAKFSTKAAQHDLELVALDIGRDRRWQWVVQLGHGLDALEVLVLHPC